MTRRVRQWVWARLMGAGLGEFLEGAALAALLWVLLWLLLPATAGAQALPTITSQNIPDFAAFPTKTAVADGDWSAAATWQPSGAPLATDVVQVPASRTVTVTNTTVAASVGVYGTLRQTAGTFTFTNILVYTGGLLDVQGSAVLVVRNTSIDTAVDPQNYGTAILGAGGRIQMAGATKTPYAQATADVQAGGTCVTLAAGPSGWAIGDRIAFPATEQWYLDAGPYSADWDETTLTSISGANICFTAVAHRHKGARNQVGTVVAWYHVANLTRSVVVRSANPQGTRGHLLMTDRTDADIRYVEFENFGRTTVDPLDPQTNPIGRYAVHFHHLVGPVAPQANGRQFTFIGNAVNHSTKWGVDIHDSHYGLVQRNVIYDAQGSSIMTEDGNEIGNLLDGNLMFVALGPGYGGYGSLADWATGGTEREDAVRSPFAGDKGWSGSCFWARGVLNDYINNICANANGFGVYIYNTQLGDMNIPDHQGADHMMTHAVDSQTVDMGRFENNQVYASADGVTIWNIREWGNGTATPCDGTGTLLLNTTLWGIGRYGYYGYSHNCLTFDGWFQYGDLSPYSWSPYVQNRGIWFGDYPSPNTVVKNATIEGLRIGLVAPFKPGDVGDIYGNAGTNFVVQNSTFANEFNISWSPMFAVGGGDGSLSQRHSFINNVQFKPMNTSNFPGGWGTCNLCMSWNIDTRNGNAIQLDTVHVSGYNGETGEFAAFYAEQAASAPATPTSEGITGVPVTGLTNAQAWAQYGLANAGRIATCELTKAGVQGFACPTGATAPSAPAAPGTAVVTP